VRSPSLSASSPSATMAFARPSVSSSCVFKFSSMLSSLKNFGSGQVEQISLSNLDWLGTAQVGPAVLLVGVVGRHTEQTVQIRHRGEPVLRHQLEQLVDDLLSLDPRLQDDVVEVVSGPGSVTDRTLRLPSNAGRDLVVGDASRRVTRQGRA